MENKNKPGRNISSSKEEILSNTQNESTGDSLLDEKAEKYLRDAGNIEDLPDEDDQRDMDKKLTDEKNK